MCQCSFSLNHGSGEITEKNMFHGPWECVLCLPFIFFPHFLRVVTMAFVCHSWKAQGYEHFPGTFYWESTDKKWLAYWEPPALRDEESVWFAEGLKTIMWTRALNKWVLMKCSHQDNTFLCVLQPRCSVQVCEGSQRNLNPCITVINIYHKDRHIGGQKNKHEAYESCPASLSPPNTLQSPLHCLLRTVRQLNWDIKYCFFPLLWRAVDPCWGLVGQHPGKRPRETKNCVVCVRVCMRVCVRACVRGNHSRRHPIITLSERAVGRNWRRGPQLSPGLAGGPQWLTASPHIHTYMRRCTPRPSHDPAWHPMNTHGYTENTGTNRNPHMCASNTLLDPRSKTGF